MSIARRLLLAVVAAVVCFETAGAQTNRLTVLTMSGFPLTSSISTTDFDAGSVSLGSTTFSVDLTSNSGQFANRVTTISIACAAPCPTNVSNLQWRRNDLGTWNTLTTGFVTVEARTATFNGANDPWGNTIVWRYLLSWTGSPPSATDEFRIQMRLQTAAP